MQAFVVHLEEKGLSASTIRQAYLLIAGAFSSALDSGLIARTPCRSIIGAAPCSTPAVFPQPGSAALGYSQSRIPGADVGDPLSNGIDEGSYVRHGVVIGAPTEVAVSPLHPWRDCSRSGS